MCKTCNTNRRTAHTVLVGKPGGHIHVRYWSRWREIKMYLDKYDVDLWPEFVWCSCWHNTHAHTISKYICMDIAKDKDLFCVKLSVEDTF